MSEKWTIRRLIAWAAEYLAGHGVESPRLSGELLLAQSLGSDRMGLYLHLDKPLEPEELAAFKALVLRRREHEPVAYILGRREFFGLGFTVGPGVLIPRPETEHLVEAALAALEGASAPRVLDVCTGSGCVALALAHARPDLAVLAVDASERALDYARTNARELGLEARVELAQGHLLAPARGQSFHLVAANPPYVAQAQWEGLEEQVKGYEPREALVPGAGGLELTGEIIARAGEVLLPGGWLMVELGMGQEAAARELARAAGCYDDVTVAPDLAGTPRVLRCRKEA